MNTIRYETEAALTFITLNRPDKRNALNPLMVSELLEALARAESEPACRVVLIQAEGQTFCAGMDLDALQEIAKLSYEENLEDARQLAELFRRLHTLSKPVIAIVTGAALAAGCGLAAVCDFTLTIPKAKFGYPEVKIGFVAAIVSVFLVPQIGAKRARALLLAGDLIDAAEALRIGLVYEIVPADQMAARARQLALALCANSPQSLRATKQLLAGDLDEALETACRLNAAARQTDDCQEGIAAFLEKRPPRWLKLV